MTNFPYSLDDDSTLPPINDNITQEGGAAINALRDVAFAMENYLGLGADGTSGSIAARLGVSLNPDGTINPSAIASLGLITLPITQDQIALNAMIPESKLRLDYRTHDLFNYIRDLSKDVNLVDGWIATTGIKLEPHLIGAIYRHTLDQIDVSDDLTNFPLLLNEFRADRNSLQSYALINDLNNELLNHEWADGYTDKVYPLVTTNSGYTYPSNFAHYAGGIFINTSQFVTIPQTNQDLQSLADYIDSSSILLLGTRIQNLYANGISVNSRSSTLTADGYGQLIVPVTIATTFLNYGNSVTPVDNIFNGDDIIQFMPTDGYTFAAQFAQVRVGDIATVNYGTIEIQYVILEKKYQQDNFGNQVFIIRIASKNLQETTSANVSITRPLFNNNKYGVLATSGVNGVVPNLPASLIVATARGAQTLGLDFSPNEFDESHYFLYLAFYPDGNPADGYTILPSIDVTGNKGTTPGVYTLESIVAATNNQLRQPGWNSRFVAFQDNGNFGIMLADSYNNASFSILSGVVDSTGAYSQAASSSSFPSNVIDLFPPVGLIGQDPLGFGPFGANVASPPYQSSYSSAGQALLPTQLFVPLKRNNYYVNGVERERMTTDVGQLLDKYGDGYWPATILTAPVIIPGPFGRVETTYTIDQDLSASQLKLGKTIVVQSIGQGGTLVDFGRFIISALSLPCDNVSGVTTITVYDAVNELGYSPTPIGGTAGVGTQVGIYFNSDSVSFNAESATDFSVVSPFKRHFEVYIDDNGGTYTHERGRMFVGTGTGSPPNVSIDAGVALYTSPSLAKFDLVKISPKLRGYQIGSVTKTSLCISNYSSTTGIYDGYLGFFDGSVIVNQGPLTYGKRGEIIRFYDQSNVDYIDITLSLDSNINTLATFAGQIMDVQLFPTLALDQEVMLISTCQLNDASFVLSQFTDQRQFGNISEEQLTTSAINYISLPDRLLHFNGVVRGFDIVNIDSQFISLTGGLALVNGQIEAVNDQIITIPFVQELYGSVKYPINFALCVNSGGELVALPITDYDAVLGTPNSPLRVVSLFNVNSLTTYNSDSNLFSYILNNRKDLTPLYVISSTVTTGPAITLQSRDVRRFVNDSDSSLPAVFTSGDSQGNFRSLSAALTWLNLNSGYQNSLQIKGTGTISSSLTLSGLQITAGASNATMIIDEPITVSNVLFKDLTIQVNSVYGFIVGSDVTFDNCNFIYNYDASSNIHYDNTNLVNDGYAMIYASIGAGQTLSNVNITGCSFFVQYLYHFGFINFQLTSPTAYVDGIVIGNNNFISQISLPQEDNTAVIAITSTLTASGVTYPFNPKIINLVIDGNICNQDQLILLSNAANPSTHYMSGGQLIAINSRISNNTCGTIGFFTSVNDTADFSNAPNITNVSDKLDHLTISGNTCKYISNLDNTGAWIEFYSDNDSAIVTVLPGVGTGQVDIINNMVGWIHAGSNGKETGSYFGVTIKNNKLVPLNPNYLENYVNRFDDTPDNIGIYLLRDNVSVGPTQSIISENILGQTSLYTSSGAISGPYYYDVGIYSGNNVQILNNNINSVVSVNLSSNRDNQLIFLDGYNSSAKYVVQGNILTRGPFNSIGGYICTSPTTGHVPVATITNNIFDSVYLDAANTILNDLVTNIPTSWKYVKNTNQVSYLAAPVYSFNAPIVSDAPGPTLTSVFTFDGETSPLTTVDSPLTFTLSNILPEGVKLLYVTLGMFDTTIVEPVSGGSSIYLEIGTSVSTQLVTPVPIPNLTPNDSYSTNSTYGGTFAGSIVDVLSNQDTTSGLVYSPNSAKINLTAGDSIIDITSKTIYLNIDMSGATFSVYTGAEYETSVTLNMNNVTTSSHSSALIMSPLVLRFAY